jgi:hypothetical protein
MIAEAPPVQGLPPPQAMALEHALIDENIGPYLAQAPRLQALSGGPGNAGFAPATPPSVIYTLLYDAPRGLGFGPVVVAVEQYPNSAWARYKAKYPSAGLFPWNEFATITKSENRIYKDSSLGGVLVFHWPSDALAVTVRYQGSQIEEDLLRRYLEKYPSSL